MSEVDEFFRLLEPPAWHKDAKCRGMFADGKERNFFFPGRSDDPDTPGGRTEEVQARKVCATCPVTKECLESAIYDLHGYWGGTSPGQRKRLRHERDMPRRTVQTTDNAGYLRSLRLRHKAEAEAAAKKWDQPA